MRTDNNTKIEFKNNRDWIKKELKQSRTKRVIDMYCKMLLNGEIDYNKLGRLYRIDQKEPSWSIKRLLKQVEVKQMINETLQNILIGEGVTQKFLIDKRKQIIDLAKDKDKLDIMLKAVEGFEDMYLMRTQNKVSNTITETVNYKQLIESPETTKKQEITASRTKNLPNSEETNNE